MLFSFQKQGREGEGQKLQICPITYKCGIVLGQNILADPIKFCLKLPLYEDRLNKKKCKHSLDIMNVVPPADKHMILSIRGRQWK